MQCDFHGKLKVHTSFSFDIFSSKILPVDVGCWELAFFVAQRTAKSRRPGPVSCESHPGRLTNNLEKRHNKGYGCKITHYLSAI